MNKHEINHVNSIIRTDTNNLISNKIT